MLKAEIIFSAAMTDLIVQRILVINVSRIGDTLLATPALRAIADAYPQASITVLGHPKRVEVLQHVPFLNRVGGITKKQAIWRGWLSKDYDLAFVWGYDQALVAYALRAAHRVVAFRQSNEKLNRALFRCVDAPLFQSDHAVNLAMTLTDAMGIGASSKRLAYQVTEQETHWAQEQLMLHSVNSSVPLIGVQVASFATKSYRDWPIENFCVLCERLREAHPQAHFLIFGGTAEASRTQALKDYLQDAATLYAGRLSLRQTAALMSQLGLYIGVDTGPTHLMSCFNIPMVGLYHGFSRSSLIAPLEHPCFYAIDHPLAGPECDESVSMADISVETVFQTAQMALSASVGCRE